MSDFLIILQRYKLFYEKPITPVAKWDAKVRVLGYFYYLCPMNFTGIIIGVATFLIIGLFHPLVIKGEYYFGVRCWWVFAVMGVVAVVAALFVENVLFSTLLAVWGASSFWSIGELFEQRKRVEKGWFPKREKRD